MSNLSRINITEIDVGGAEAEELILGAIRSGQLASGPLVRQLESGFADYIGVKHALAVNNGTTALIGALQASGIRPGDEVITTPFTFAATINAILEVGAIVRFADIGSDFNIDPSKIADLIGPSTRALMPVHLYGQCADMEPIMNLAVAHDICVIEDAAQAHGASYRAKKAGSFGVGCFSLYATKNMTTGEGGFVTTNDDDVADRLSILRNQGMRQRYQYEVPGHNWRLTDLQAAIGIPQIKSLDERTATRNKIAAQLSAGLEGIPGLVTPRIEDGRTHVWHQYTVRVTSEAAIDRDALHRSLDADGISSGMYYPAAAFDHQCYRDHPSVADDPAPLAVEFASQVLSLPVHPRLGSGDVERIVDGVRRAFC